MQFNRTKNWIRKGLGLLCWRMKETKSNPEPTAIKSVGYYMACPVATCDRCGQGIKHVFPVSLKDGTVFRYGSECINTVLAGDTTLKGLWNKNAKLLAKYKHWLEILNMPASEMPVGKNACNARPGDTTRFVGDEKGSWLGIECNVFHPAPEFRPSTFDGTREDFDMRKCGKSAWERNSPENWDIRVQAGIERQKKQLNEQIARIEPFLARILAKGLAGQQQPQQQAA